LEPFVTDPNKHLLSIISAIRLITPMVGVLNKGAGIATIVGEYSKQKNGDHGLSVPSGRYIIRGRRTLQIAKQFSMDKPKQPKIEKKLNNSG